MVIHIADSDDLPELKRHDHWITARELERKVFREEVYVLRGRGCIHRLDAVWPVLG